MGDDEEAAPEASAGDGEAVVPEAPVEDDEVVAAVRKVSAAGRVWGA